MKFRAGQIIQLINNRNMNAMVGAKAIVISQNNNYVIVKWIKGTGARSQMDGEYYPETFKLLSEPSGQLLFNFMYEKV